MKNTIYTLLVIFIGCMSIKAQEQTTATENPLSKLLFIVGDWEGDTWMMTQNGKQTSKIKETASCKAGCTVLAIEGLGTKTDPETQETKVVHDAFGVMFYDTISEQLKMRAYKDGKETESVIEFIEDKKIRWFLDIPNGGKVRFTVDYSTENKWIEIGEFSRDGENWMQFLGMDLTRVTN